MTTQPVLPGAVLGVLGGGQLGRMFSIAARRLGYRVHIYSPDRSTPAGQVADVEHVAEYTDLDRLSEFARGIDVCTFEFENVPSAVSDTIEKFAPVRPSGRVLNVSQHRLKEKDMLSKAGLPVPQYRRIQSLSDLRTAADELGLPCVIKTATSGYDGKGQAVIDSRDACESAWNALATDEAILEQFVDFECELSVIGARNPQGQVAFYGPFRNTHRNHILDITICPAGLTPQVEQTALEVTRTVLESLDVVGVLCVEMFLTRNGRVLVNELAPRPHNSGHLTIDAHFTCQFEQQVRAVCGLPLGSCYQHAPAAMANLLGDLWENSEPDWASLLAEPAVKLHLYGKESARRGRKMGHITALADRIDDALSAVQTARSRLVPPGSSLAQR